MGREQVDQRLLDRLKRFAEGAGSASAKTTVLSWVKRMEEGDPAGVSAAHLDQLIRAITRISLARSYYALDHAHDGLRVDVVTHRRGAMVEALKLEMDITETLVQDEKVRLRLSASRADVSGKVLSELEGAFVKAFSD